MRLQNVLNKMIEYGFYSLFFLTPLLFNPSRTIPSFELFEWNKMMFVYAAATGIVGAWVGRMILHRKIIFQRTPLDLPLLLFLLAQALSTLFSIDRHVSIFGYYSRFHGGLLSTITYISLYYALVSNWSLISRRNLFLFTFSSGIVVTTYGILEKFGIDASMWVQDVRARVFSTLGQPNWLAAYLAVLLPLSISQTLNFMLSKKSPSDSKIQNSQPKADRPLDEKFYPPAGRHSFSSKFKIGLLGYWVIGLLFYLCLLFTRSRSGFLGFWIANGFFWLLLFLLNHARPKRFLPLFILLNSSFLILNFFIRTPFPQYNRLATIDLVNQQSVVEETVPPSGDSVINIGVTDSAKIRQVVWKGAFAIIRDYPLFGTGPETFAYAYYKYRPAEHNLTSEWDFLYNRAHNEFLNIAATSGLFGLGTYLFLIGCVIIWTIRRLLTMEQWNNESTIILALLASYISILITNFFGFSVVAVGLAFFLIPAIIFGLNHMGAISDNLANAKASLSKLTGIFLLLDAFVVLFLLANLARLWVSDSLYAQAMGFSRQELYSEAYPPIELAVNLRPDEPVYHDEKANIASGMAALAIENSEGTRAAELAQEAVTESSQALAISPQNVNFWKTRTRVLYLLSTADPSFTDQALQAIMVAQELAPTDAKIAYNVAVLLGRAGKNAEAIETLKKTIELKADYRDAYIALSIFYEEGGQIEDAREVLQQVLQRINPEDQEIKERLEKLQ